MVSSLLPTMDILPLAYLGNIQYFSKLVTGQAVIDLYEHYVKQSCRNRCEILGTNGPITLTVNVAKQSGTKQLVRDVKIDYSKRWQHLHWISLVSGYKSSPYFDHYADRLAPFYERHWTFLADYDIELTHVLLDALHCNVPIRFTEQYAVPNANDRDYRSSLSSKPRLNRPDPTFFPYPYYQVFSEKIPFTPNLSVIDLLFCEGPGALDIIKNSIRPAILPSTENETP